MAECKKIPPKSPPAQYQLTLTEDEAKVLMIVMYNTSTPNGQAGAIFDALREHLELFAAQKQYAILHGTNPVVKEIY